LFQHEEPKGIGIKPTMSDSWSACLQTLEGHSNTVTLVAFSHDSAQLASASSDSTVKIWDASSGACLHMLEGHGGSVYSVAFSHDSAQLASASDDKTVKIWDASSGACLQTLNIGKALLRLSFDSTGSYLYTEIGTIVVRNSQVGVSDVVEPKRPLYLGIGVSSDSIWIKHTGKSMLWVPSEYRPPCSAVCGNTVGIGVGSGRVWICSIDLDHE
jgi:WD40 repeat protein